MQNTVRTTIRIRKDLLDQSKMVALKRGTSLQQVINDTLALGFHKTSPGISRRKIMEEVDRLRDEIYKEHGFIDTKELVEMNKQELQKRADKVLNTLKTK